MTRIPIDELRRLGITSEDIDMARTTQEAQRRNGSPVQSIAVLVGAAQPRARPNPNPPVDLTDRALRRRGAYDQAALLLDQAHRHLELPRARDAEGFFRESPRGYRNHLPDPGRARRQKPPPALGAVASEAVPDHSSGNFSPFCML